MPSSGSGGIRCVVCVCECVSESAVKNLVPSSGSEESDVCVCVCVCVCF